MSVPVPLYLFSADRHAACPPWHQERSPYASRRLQYTYKLCPPLYGRSDVDGTLLNPQQQLTSGTRAALQAAAAAGVPIVVATGGPQWLGAGLLLGA